MNYKKGTQTRGCMKSVMRYVSQLSKTLWDGQQLVSGIDCQPETAFDEFLSTKLLHHKDGGVMFYHMVQSFPKGAAIDSRTVSSHQSSIPSKSLARNALVTSFRLLPEEPLSTIIEVEERASLKYIRGQEAFIPKPPPT